MAKSSLTVKQRERTGKTGAVKVRKDKLIPAVLYGKGMEAVCIEVSPEDLKTALGTDKNTLLEISVENSDIKPSLSIIKDVQKDPLTGKTKHLDFQSIDPDTKLRVEVPIEFTGKSRGMKEGGILEVIERNFRVKCLPENIPAFIEVDITELEIGDSLHVRDLSFAGELEILNSADEPVVMVIAPRAAISEAAKTTTEQGEEGEEGEGAEGEAAEGEETAAEGGESAGKEGDKE